MEKNPKKTSSKKNVDKSESKGEVKSEKKDSNKHQKLVNKKSHEMKADNSTEKNHAKNKEENEISAALENVAIQGASLIQLNSGDLDKQYDIGEVIGKGAFAVVRKVTRKSGGEVRALKKIKKGKSKDIARVIMEVNILKQLAHPNIMQIFDFYQDKKYLYIVTELCEGGELFDKIIDKGSFSEGEAAIVMYQLLSAMNYAHANHIVHRDLKPENILLDSRKDFIIKIIDWGTARAFNSNKKMKHISGTPYYIAPEVLAGNYDEKCDIWSCGIILYILLCGYPPFNADSDDEILEKIKAGKYIFPKEEWDTVSKDAKEFIGKLLEYNPKKRLSAAQALEDKWITNNRTKKFSKEDAKNSQHFLANMQRFRANRKLEQTALSYIAHNLISKQEKRDLLQLFHEFDENGDGVLTKQEIINGYKRLMPLEANALIADIDKIFQQIDVDNSGTIDYNEFVMASINHDELTQQKNLKETFNLFDKDGNGSISIDEIVEALGHSIDKDTIRLLVKEVDTDGNGEIDFSEFCQMMGKCTGITSATEDLDDDK